MKNKLRGFSLTASFAFIFLTLLFAEELERSAKYSDVPTSWLYMAIFWILGFFFGMVSGLTTFVSLDVLPNLRKTFNVISALFFAIFFITWAIFGTNSDFNFNWMICTLIFFSLVGAGSRIVAELISAGEYLSNLKKN